MKLSSPAAAPGCPATLSAALLLSLLLLAAASSPGTSTETQKGKQKAFRQREVVDVVSGRPGGRSGGAGAQQGTAGEEGTRALCVSFSRGQAPSLGVKGRGWVGFIFFL